MSEGSHPCVSILDVLFATFSFKEKVETNISAEKEIGRLHAEETKSAGLCPDKESNGIRSIELRVLSHMLNLVDTIHQARPRKDQRDSSDALCP